MPHLAFVVLALFFIGSSAQADRLGDVAIWPAGPAVLKTGNQVRVEWYYLIEDRAGAYMYARPLKDGAPVAGYAASGSPLYRGEGQARAEFTLQGHGDVDAIRIQIVDQNRNVRHQTVVPVELRFAQNPLGGGGGVPLRVIPEVAQPLGATRLRDDIRADLGTTRPLLQAERLRPMLTPDLFRRVTPALPDDLDLPGDNMQPMQNLASVPAPVDEGGIDAEWIGQLENWLGHVTLMQGFDIMRLMGGGAAFDQYMQMEQADGPTVYEVLDRRRKTIGNLLDGF